MSLNEAEEAALNGRYTYALRVDRMFYRRTTSQMVARDL